MKQLIHGIEIIGKAKGGGYKNQFYLIRTPSKRFIQLSELLYHTVIALKENPNEDAVAARVSELQNKDVDINAVRYIIATKLEPLGIINDTQIIFQDKKKKPQVTQSADMLHALKFRITLIPEKVVPFIAQLYTPLFNPWIMLLVCMSVVLLNVWLFGIHGIDAGLKQTLFEPALFLLVFGLIILSSLFHEIGHAAGAMYGGSKPGRIGAGIYLIWPAFFTDITDVYRLGKKARLRSDFGGIYFNLVFSVLIGIVYFVTRFEPLLLLILFQNLVVVQQLLPIMRLDGYFIVSDLVGVPDLFARIQPIIKSIFLRKESNATKDLKLWVKLVVTFWVISVIPLLLLIIGFIFISAPNIFSTAMASAQIQISAITESMQQKDYFVSFVKTIQLFILFLPVLGICTITYLLGKPLILKINAKLDSSMTPRIEPGTGFPLNRSINK